MSSAGKITSTADTIQNIIGVLGMLASIALPESATVVSIVKIATAVGQGLKDEAPAAQALYDEIVALKNGAGVATHEQWVAWDAAADAASLDLDAAEDRLQARHPKVLS